MSLHRQAAKRDTNEPAIRARLKAHGWHTEQVSAKGFPDLIGWSKHRVDALLLEVKMPGEGPTPAQDEKWRELLTRGIRVYVLETDADVDALVKGRLEPWTPGGTVDVPARKPKEHRPGMSKARTVGDMCREMHCTTSHLPRGRYCSAHEESRGQIATAPGSGRVKACGCKRSLGRCAHSGSYAPPTTTRPDASALAAETFAPPSHAPMLRLLDAQERASLVAPSITVVQGNVAPFEPPLSAGYEYATGGIVRTAPPAAHGCTLEVECAEHAGRPA